MRTSRQDDIALLKSLTDDQLYDLFFMYVRNIWSVDGLYFLGIENRSGNETAVEVDSEVWKIMGTIEMKRFLDVFDVDESRSFDTFVKIIKITAWWLNIEEKSYEYYPDENRLVLTNHDCRVQNRRISKGLPEFPCRSVRQGYLESFVKTYSEKIKVKCNICPPEDHPDDLWCEWEFVMVDDDP